MNPTHLFGGWHNARRGDCHSPSRRLESIVLADRQRLANTLPRNEPTRRAGCQPPDTGGIKATVSPSFTCAPQSTNDSFSAKRTLPRWGDSAG